MDLITQFALGDDIAWLLLILGVLALAAITLGVLIPPRLARHGAAIARRRAAEDDGPDAVDDAYNGEVAAADAAAPRAARANDPDLVDEEETDTGDPAVDASLPSRLGRLITQATVLSSWIAVPLALLLAFLPGSTDVRILRAGFLVLGLIAGALAAGRGGSMLLTGLAIAPSDRLRSLSRFGGLFVASAIAIGALPIVPTVYFLREGAASPLIAYAAGAALFALALQAIASLAHSTGLSAALLVGADENGLGAEDEDNPGAAHLHVAQLLRRGPARAATLVALVAALAAAAIRVGVPVIAAEGFVIPLLGLSIAILAALVVAAFPHVGAGSERSVLRLGALVPALLAGGGFAAGIALWLPTTYQSLRFTHVGMDYFTDVALTGGGEPVARAYMEPQILAGIEDMSQWITVTDESRYASAFLDLMALYGISPAGVAAAAAGLGALVALIAQLLVSRALNPREAGVLRIARTHRTGGALGTVSALGSSAVVAAGAIGAVIALLGILFVVGDGIPELMLVLLAYAGLGALVVSAATAAFHTSAAIADRPGSADGVREASRGGGSETAVGLQIALALAAAPLVMPMIGAIQAAGRAASVWEDRSLHLMTSASATVIAGGALGLLAALLIGAGMLLGQRRLAIAAVVETRAALIGEQSSILLPDLSGTAVRATLPVLATAAAMPFVAGFGLGPGALPAFTVSLLVAALVLAVMTTILAGISRSALAVISAGRYGGPGSWGHSGALGGTVLAGTLRDALGTLISLGALLGALIGVLTVSSMVNAMVDGTDAWLRWGAAVVALLLAGGAWLYALTAPEVDLEDELGEQSAPLFSRRAQGEAEEDSRGDLLLDWSDEADEDEDADAVRRVRRGSGSSSSTNGAPRAGRSRKGSARRR